MADVTIKRIEELDYYQGPGAIEGIKFRYAGKHLGVTAWGMNVIELAPHCAGYPDYDHASDGQEEVYVVLRGAARLRTGEAEQRLEAGALVRVAPGQRRADHRRRRRDAAGDRRHAGAGLQSGAVATCDIDPAAMSEQPPPRCPVTMAR